MAPFLAFLRAGSDLHRAAPQADGGFVIEPLADDPPARAAFQTVAELAVEGDGHGWRVVDVEMSEDGEAYLAVRIAAP